MPSSSEASDAPLRVLVVADTDEAASAALCALGQGGLPPAWERVDDVGALKSALAQRTWDVAVCDWEMARLAPLEALAVLRDAPDVPCFVVTTDPSESATAAATTAGATALVAKSQPGRLASAIARLTDERRARAAQWQADDRYRLLFEVSPLPMWVIDTTTFRFLSINAAGLKHLGYTREELARKTVLDIRPPDDALAVRHDVADPSIEPLGLWRHLTKDGRIRRVEIRSRAFDLDGQKARFVIVADVTDRLEAEEALRATEEQLRQAQKLEAIGSLAGGVAHDFNNLLSIIVSYADLAISALPAGDPLRSEIGEIRSAGERAAALTRQLLAFSRRQMLEPRTIDPNKLLAGLEGMLRRLVGEHVRLTVHAERPVGRIHADPSQIEQVILNLVINARDAMPAGGDVVLETSTVVLDEDYARAHVGVSPGAYLLLAVTDTGAGMDSATQARIFEPFFTTKPAGQGTGLGLSTVFGIVKQSGGHIWVYSEVGHGTTFKVYFPISERPEEQLPEPTAPAELRGTETILLVEDDDAVRGVMRTVLARAGYTVFEAQNGGEAFLLGEEHTGELPLLITDVVMPRVSGKVVAERLRQRRPSMRVLYVSGYTENSIVHHGVLDPGIAFLQKPITPAGLLKKVREVLDG